MKVLTRTCWTSKGWDKVGKESILRFWNKYGILPVAYKAGLVELYGKISG